MILREPKGSLSFYLLFFGIIIAVSNIGAKPNSLTENSRKNCKSAIGETRVLIKFGMSALSQLFDTSNFSMFIETRPLDKGDVLDGFTPRQK